MRVSCLGLVLVVCLISASCRTAVAPSVWPTIVLFAADQTKILVGTATILRWDVQGLEVQRRIDPLIGHVPPTGSVEVRPLLTTTYTLTATTAAGSLSRSLTILVQ
jgi:hypothetical protein